MVQNISFPKKGKSTLHNPIPRKGGWLPWFKYDPAFWQDYAPAKQIPYMPGMVEDLEKEMSLEDQFKKNGGITEEKPSGATGE